VRGEWWPLERGGITLIVLGAFYFALGLAFPAGMGLGDIKWAGLLGLYLGWVRWEAASTATLIAFAAAALFVLGARDARRTRQFVLPMAPFMTAGALVAVLILR
jgi:leader peptidase (prepilin peptidase) / N-methyltransferase